MEEIIDKNKTIETKEEIKKKKQFTIFGFTITKILAYFIIYSIIG